MATAMDPFSMFMLTTGPAFLKTDEDVINAVVRNSYILPRFMEGKEMNLLLQGGTKLQDILYLNEDSAAEFYGAHDQDFEYRNQQVGTAWETHWRFLANHTSWTDHEIELQGGDSGGGLSDTIGAFHRYKRAKHLKMMNLWTTQIHKMEDALVGQPVRDTMEVGSGTIPQSLFCFLTAPSSAGNTGLPNTGTSSSAWTTVQNIAPSTTAGAEGFRWRNQAVSYVGTTATLAESFWGGMRSLYAQCRFERLPRFGSFSDPTRSPAFYMVSLWGLVLAESMLRSPQDLLLAGRQDAAFPAPMFHGVPFVYNAQLNSSATSLAYFNSTANTTGYVNEATAPIVGPRVWAINGHTVNLIMHKRRVFHRLPPFSPDNQPFKKVLMTDCWYNLTDQNRRELGVLHPSVAVTVPANPGLGV